MGYFLQMHFIFIYLLFDEIFIGYSYKLGKYFLKLQQNKNFPLEVIHPIMTHGPQFSALS